MISASYLAFPYRHGGFKKQKKRKKKKKGNVFVIRFLFNWRNLQPPPSTSVDVQVTDEPLLALN